MLGRLADEEDLAMLRIGRVGKEHQHRLLLIDAAEVIQVAVLGKAESAVRVRGHHIVGMQNHEGAGRQEGGEATAVLDEEFGGGGLVAHGGAGGWVYGERGR